MSEVDALAPAGRLGRYLSRVLGDPRWADVRATLIAGGKSNLTFELSSPAGRLILRRPPSGRLLPTAHDMAREARVQRALAGTEVPVPPIVAADESGDVIGVPCYVMRHVAGHIVRDRLPDGYAPTAADRRRIADTLIDVLVRLHAVDPAAVGLAGFGRPEGFLARQVRRWQQQWAASRGAAVPAVDALGAGLAARVPASPPPAIVHGDYRLDNCILDLREPGVIAAVLDWEMSTLGDPLTDLGLLLFYWDAGSGAATLTPRVTRMPGFPDGSRLVERYARASRRDVTNLGYYRAFAHFKFAVIAQGIAARVRAGAMAGQDFGDLRGEVVSIAEAGLALLTS